jgi:hypothetical protein
MRRSTVGVMSNTAALLRRQMMWLTIGAVMAGAAISAASASALTARATTAGAAARKGATVHLSATQVHRLTQQWEGLVSTEFQGAASTAQYHAICGEFTPYARRVLTKKFAHRSSSACGARFQTAFKVVHELMSSKLDATGFWADYWSTKLTGRAVRSHGDLWATAQPKTRWLTGTWFVADGSDWKVGGMLPLLPGEA